MSFYKYSTVNFYALISIFTKPNHRLLKEQLQNFYFPDDDLFTPFERRKGLPIGNLTSQFFANVYLNAFDHFIKEELRRALFGQYTFSMQKQE
ncbi:MAG: RNA-directed DNA polymerase [candidate division KSB1 bacterium]|nr:RNA-directed DNA polymerase [candidate division KSB1 bacterium]MDZ7304288.1 RNA-directed DNA polymerase [candidate division KSB1 bacterium]MDZ7312913.1 RNA-directed DNA polymerase [candidate division KSB1 bacterium]